MLTNLSNIANTAFISALRKLGYVVVKKSDLHELEESVHKFDQHVFTNANMTDSSGKLNNHDEIEANWKTYHVLYDDVITNIRIMSGSSWIKNRRK
jgi:hypothetical protein